MVTIHVLVEEMELRW